MEETKTIFSHMSLPDIDGFISTALSRQPRKHLDKEILLKYRIYLNKSKTIYIQPVLFYGGEHFHEPHYFIGEIGHSTSNSSFSRFVNKLRPIVGLRKRLAFTY
jgi:hypothetical protein